MNRKSIKFFYCQDIINVTGMRNRISSEQQQRSETIDFALFFGIIFRYRLHFTFQMRFKNCVKNMNKQGHKNEFNNVWFRDGKD